MYAHRPLVNPGPHQGQPRHHRHPPDRRQRRSSQSRQIRQSLAGEVIKKLSLLFTKIV